MRGVTDSADPPGRCMQETTHLGDLVETVFESAVLLAAQGGAIVSRALLDRGVRR